MARHLKDMVTRAGSTSEAPTNEERSASDVEPRNGFRAYARSRAMTGLAMVVCSWAYLAFSAYKVGYTPDKVWAVALMTLFKCVDVIEDVFDGNFQQQGRLDVAGRQMTLRVGSSTLVFCAVAAISGSLVLAIAAATIWGLAFLGVSLSLISSRYKLPAYSPKAPNQSALPLIRQFFPLFVTAFLLFYVGNAPKWAIDVVMDDVAQAHYGFIAMPVFMVNLLSQFVYMPMVRPISDMWDAGDGKGFRHAFVLQVGIIAVITVVCVAGAAVLGVPVLSVLYNTDLSPFAWSCACWCWVAASWRWPAWPTWASPSCASRTNWCGAMWPWRWRPSLSQRLWCELGASPVPPLATLRAWLCWLVGLARCFGWTLGRGSGSREVAVPRIAVSMIRALNKKRSGRSNTSARREN